MTAQKILSHEETIALIISAQKGDEDALDTLFRNNMPLVHSVAQKYRCSMDYDDLFQTGCLGLLKAIRRFDISFDVRFSTYAVPVIAGEIKRTLRDEGSVKVSRSLKELGIRAMQAGEILRAELEREPTIEEIAEKIGCDVSEVAESLEAISPQTSLFEPAYDDDSEACIGDRISDGRDMQSEIMNELLLQDALSSLSERDRALIDMRYFRNMTQSQTARVLGMSQVQVSRLETRIIKGMREELLS